jgi:anti-anti-sigma factor
MAGEPLEVRVEAGPQTGRVVLSGRLDREGDAAMAGAYDRAIAEGANVVVLDFGAVDYINSTGIALVVRLLAEARRDRREVQATGLTEHYREIFRITRLADLMTIVDGTDASGEAA